MVQNLNAVSFQRFGTLPMDGARAEARETLLRPETGEGFTVCPAAALLEPVRGMTALCVCAGEETAAFYLDKPVCLRPGVAFRLLPMRPDCCVRLLLPLNAPLRPLERRVEPPSLTLEPSLRMERIYTLFVQEKPRGFFFRGERHPPYELTLVRAGRLHCVVGGREYTLATGQLLLCLPDQWHMQYADPDEAACFATVSFDMLCPQAAALGGRVLRATEAMEATLESMLDAVGGDEPFHADRQLLRLTSLVLDLRGLALGQEAASVGESPLTERALRYINDHLGQHLTVAQVASAVSVSAPYLAVLFRRQLHQSPAETIRRLKLEEGRLLLRQGAMNVQETARALGFATPQHFSRCFKAYFGDSPKAYGKR